MDALSLSVLLEAFDNMLQGHSIRSRQPEPATYLIVSPQTPPSQNNGNKHPVPAPENPQRYPAASDEGIEGTVEFLYETRG